MKTRTAIAFGCLLLSALAAFAVSPDTPETWNSGETAGWIRWDPLNAYEWPLSNPTNYVQMVFDAQDQPFPEVNILKADLSASGGSFTGSYWWAAITNVSFKLYCDRHIPADLRLYLCNAASTNWWYCPLSVPGTGQWIECSVPVDYARGWRLLDGTSAAFKNDLQGIDWIGIEIQRHQSTEQQVYRIDDFVVEGASKLKDADNDGANDWHEFIAGTGIDDAGSLFRLEIALTNTGKAKPDAELKWTSASDRLYTILRSTNLVEGFVPIRTNVTGRPPRNREVDTNVDASPVYYRVDVE